jgi:hypothetical protein
MSAIIKTEGAFLSKFLNPFNMKSADFQMKGAEKEQFLMLSMKHAGSLIIISHTGRFSTKNGADSKFTDIAYLVFRTWMGDDLEKFLTLIKKNKLSIGLELVVPRILGEHPGEALVPYFAVTSVTNVTTLQHLSQDNLIKFCLNNKLPCGEHWLIPNLLGQTKFDDIIDEIDKIRFKNSGDSGDSCGDGGTSEFINKINELTSARGGIAFLGNIPHGEVQGKVCEGVIARILPRSALLKIQDMNDILQGNKGDFDKRLEKLKKLGEWFKDHYNFENIIYKQDEIKSFFNKVWERVDKEDPLFHAKTGKLVEQYDRYWFLNHLIHSSKMGGKEAPLLLESLLELSQLKKQWLSPSKQDKIVSSGNINKVKSEPHKLIERITEIYKSAEINEDFAKLVSELRILDKRKVNGLSDKLKSLEEAILEELIKELEQDSQSSSNKDELSPILVELKRLKKTKDEEFNKRFISLIGSEHKIKYLIQKISALKSSSGHKDLEQFLSNPPEDLKDKLPSLKKEALNLLKKELKELQREIEALWNVSVYLQSDGSYIVHIKLLHDMSLVNVPGLHLRRGHIVSVDVANSSINLVGAGHITDELDDEIQKLFEDSKKINEDAIGIIKLKNQKYMELRSIRETLNALWKKLKGGSPAGNKWLTKIEFLNTFKKQLKSDLKPMIFNLMGGSNVNVLTLADQAFNRMNLGEFYEFLRKKLPLEKIDIDSSACLMPLYEKLNSQENIPEEQLTCQNVEDFSVKSSGNRVNFFSVSGVEEENNPNGGSASSPASLARIH